MAVVSVPYGSGSIVSVSGTTLTISGGAVSAWVGRCIRLSTGSGAGQSRKIVSVVNATTITIDFPFSNVYTRLAMAAHIDVNPVAGDSFVISHYISDFADGTSVIIDAGTNSFRFVGASTFSNGVFIYAINSRIDMLSSSLAGNQAVQANRVAWRFGDIDSSGNVFNGCYLLDTAASPSSFGSGAAGTFDPDFEFYGSIGRLTGAAPFWRLHTDNSERVRIIGCRFDGSIGGRMQGSRSGFDEWEVYNNQSQNGPFNAKSSFGFISNIRVSNSLQAAYHFWPDSLTLELEGIKLGPNVSRGVRFANSTTSGQMLTIKDIDINAWAALPNLYNNSSGTYSNTFRLSQYLDASYRNAAGSAIIDSTRFVIRDITPTVVYDSTVGTGIIPRQQLRYRDMTILNTGNFTWATAGGTTFAPYQIGACSYLNQPSTANLPLLTSQNVTLLALPDTNITEVNKATVDAYSSISNLDQLYDRCKSWTVDNLSLANPSFGAQVANGNGSELNLGAFNLVVNDLAAQAFSISGNTITIKTLSLDSGIKFTNLRTTGTLTLLNGSIMNISYSTGAGSFAIISISGLIVGSRVQIYNVTDNTEMANFVASNSNYSNMFQWPGVRTVRVRVSRAGYIDYENTGLFLSTGVAFSANLQVDNIYVLNNLTGSNVTEFTPNYVNNTIDITAVIAETSVQRVYAWYHHVCESADGIRNFFGAIKAEDEANYLINSSLINLTINNTNATPVIISGARLYRSDSQTVIYATSGPLQLDPFKAYVASSAYIQTQLDKISNNTGLIPALL